MSRTPGKAATHSVRPFRMGDVVTIAGQKGEAVIHEAHFAEGSFQYSTNKGAWYAHEICTLVRECDESSLELLRNDLQDEEDDESEEC